MATPIVEARAFRIWQYANPRYWDVSYQELQSALGMTFHEVQWTIRVKGWGGRIAAHNYVRIGKMVAQYRHDRVGPKGLFKETCAKPVCPATAPIDELMAAGTFAAIDE